MCNIRKNNFVSEQLQFLYKSCLYDQIFSVIESFGLFGDKIQTKRNVLLTADSHLWLIIRKYAFHNSSCVVFFFFKLTAKGHVKTVQNLKTKHLSSFPFKYRESFFFPTKDGYSSLSLSLAT